MLGRAVRAMRWRTLFVLLWLIAHRAAATDIYLPGPDSNGGSIELAISVAREEVASQKANGLRQPITVHIPAGKYLIERAITLSSADSGTEAAPITFQGASFASVYISGATSIQSRPVIAGEPLADRLPVDMRTAGRVADLVQVAFDGEVGGRAVSRAYRAFEPVVAYGGSLLRSARFPNDRYLEISDAKRGPSGEWSFGIGQPVPVKWAREREPWLRGYLMHDWSDIYLPVSIDDASDARPFRFPRGEPPDGITRGGRVIFQNMLSELDAAGEMYVDRDSGSLYFIPPVESKDSLVEVSVSQQLLVITGASFLRFDNITFEMSKGTAIQIDGGSNVEVSNCRIRFTADNAITLAGENHSVYNCEISDIGASGITLAAGDRQTLARGNLRAQGNTIRRVAQRHKTYTPAIDILGVGNAAVGNRISDSPHIAIRFGGNDHLIQQNAITDVCKETNDVGAIYTGRDWTARGTRILSNTIYGLEGIKNQQCIGVYLDDQASGIAVTDNRFYALPYAILIGGGREIEVVGNDCAFVLTCIRLDARGEREGNGYQSTLYSRLMQVPFDRDPYTKYPYLATILQDRPGSPRRILVAENLSINTGRFLDVEPPAESALTQLANMDASTVHLPRLELSPIPQFGGDVKKIQAALLGLRQRFGPCVRNSSMADGCSLK